MPRAPFATFEKRHEPQALASARVTAPIHFRRPAAPPRGMLQNDHIAVAPAKQARPVPPARDNAHPKQKNANAGG